MTVPGLLVQAYARLEAWCSTAICDTGVLPIVPLVPFSHSGTGVPGDLFHDSLWSIPIRSNTTA